MFFTTLVGSNPYSYLLILLIGGLISLLAFLIIKWNYTHYLHSITKEELKIKTKAKQTTLRQIQQLNQELKPYGFAYDKKQDMFYSLMNGWQREFGYCKLYDEGSAPLSMIIDCEPIYFTYNNKKWLIEFWKGQYGITTGCEIGIYNTEEEDIHIPHIFDGTFYEGIANDERLILSFALYKDETLLFSKRELHWWLSAFKLGEFSNPSELHMYIEIVFPNTVMLNAFIEGLKEAGYEEEEYFIHYTKVSILYTIPHTKQPLTKSALTMHIMQKNNQQICNTYHNLTKDYSTTIEKLVYLKNKAPTIYEEAINIGKTKSLLKIFETIKDFVHKK